MRPTVPLSIGNPSTLSTLSAICRWLLTLRDRREELDQVLKQLGEKKTLLTRMFGKQREGEPQ